jgi:hypothetical protein
VNDPARVLLSVALAVALASVSSAAPAPLAKVPREDRPSEEGLLRALQARGVIVLDVILEVELAEGLRIVSVRLDEAGDGRFPRDAKLSMKTENADRRAVLRELLKEVIREGGVNRLEVRVF